MRFHRVLTAAVAAITLALPLAAESRSNDDLSYNSYLNGSQFGGQGSSYGYGDSSFVVNPHTNRATVRFNTRGLGGTITGAGLYRRSGNSYSQVLSFTDADNLFDEDGTFDRELSISPELLNEILANPSNFAIRVNTGEYPQGALSGSLMSGQTYGGTFSGSSLVGTTGAANGGGFFTADIVPNASGSGSTLNYSFTPSGIGSSISGLQLFQGQAGANGSSFLTLSNGGTLSNGRMSGSVQLTQAQAQQLLANPSGFYVTANTSQFPQGAVRAQFGRLENELYLPVAGTVNGALGSRWQTDLQFFGGSSSAPSTVAVQWLPSGQPNLGNGSVNASSAAATVVPGGGVANIANGLQSLFNMSSGMGALRIVSDQPIIAIGRIFDTANDNHGHTAQPIAALSRDEALTRGILIGAVNANAPSVNSRTNIGFFNPNPVPVTVNLTSWAQNGNGNGTGGQTVTSVPVTLQPYQQLQMPLVGSAGLFPTQQFAGGAVTFEASAPIFAYTSLTNNGNGDTHLVMAKQDLSARASMSQSDIAAIVTTANQGEVQQGNLALTRATAPSVRNFAQMMVDEHTAALQQAQTLFSSLNLSPTSSATSNFLNTTVQQSITTLNGMSGTQFDRAYMQSQVVMHQTVLATLNQVLIPSVQDPQLRNLLQVQAAQVAAHLQKAQQILAGLQ